MRRQGVRHRITTALENHGEGKFMKFRKSCFVAIAFLLAAGVACAQTANIDFGTNYQTIRGFGASEAWSWTMSSSQIQTLYGMGSGKWG